jgi:prepilin-type processing-associated H-X9-DG protein
MAWEEGKRLSFDDITDTTSNTIMVVEVRGSQIHWAEPVDFDGTASLKINARPGLSIGSHCLGGANVVFVDASVVHLRETTSEEEIKALLTPDGGEKVNWLREAVRK